MTHAHRRPRSSKLWFRMDVPHGTRKLAGVTSWQKSLDTADPTLADARRAAWSAHFKAEVIRLRAINKQQAAQDAEQLVTRAFRKMAEYFRSMDIAVSSELTKVAPIVRSSWSNDHARAVEIQYHGEAYTSLHDAEGGDSGMRWG